VRNKRASVRRTLPLLRRKRRPENGAIVPEQLILALCRGGEKDNGFIEMTRVGTQRNKGS
jgi:hypothetical protein